MIYIIRHGQTEMNGAHLLQGRSDSPLNEAGIQQAKEARDRLKDVIFSYVFTSPLKRAVQTANIIAPEVLPVVDERLIEMDYGPYEGTDLNHLPTEIVTFFSDFANNPVPNGMEQLPSVVARAGEFMDEIRDLEGNILISTHAIAMKGILEYLTPESKGSYWSKYIGNCSIFTVDNQRDAAPIEYTLHQKEKQEQ